jgi:hypothetical protein
MALADHKPGAVKSNHGPQCGMAVIIANLDEHDAGELQSWLDDKCLGHYQIATALKNAGHPISRQQVSWHRRGECKCQA